MRKSKIVMSVLALILISLFIQMPAQAQSGSLDDLAIDIQHSATTWAQGKLSYNFMIDVQAGPAISNLMIETNHGTIYTEGEIGGFSANRYGLGFLETEDDLKSIEIKKATAKINGRTVDVTAALSIRDFEPIKISIAKNSMAPLSSLMTGLYINCLTPDSCETQKANFYSQEEDEANSDWSTMFLAGDHTGWLSVGGGKTGYDIKWRLEGDKLIITWENQSKPMVFQINGDRLIIKQATGQESVMVHVLTEEQLQNAG